MGQCIALSNFSSDDYFMAKFNEVTSELNLSAQKQLRIQSKTMFCFDRGYIFSNISQTDSSNFIYFPNHLFFFGSLENNLPSSKAVLFIKNQSQCPDYKFKGDWNQAKLQKGTITFKDNQIDHIIKIKNIGSNRFKITALGNFQYEGQIKKRQNKYVFNEKESSNFKIRSSQMESGQMVRYMDQGHINGMRKLKKETITKVKNMAKVKQSMKMNQQLNATLKTENQNQNKRYILRSKERNWRQLLNKTDDSRVLKTVNFVNVTDFYQLKVSYIPHRISFH